MAMFNSYVCLPEGRFWLMFNSYWCVLRREWMGGLLGFLLVMKWIIPENSLSTSKNRFQCSFVDVSLKIL